MNKRNNEPMPLFDLIDEVREAIARYDASGDHVTGHYGDDCIRCQLVRALPECVQYQLRKKA